MRSHCRQHPASSEGPAAVPLDRELIAARIDCRLADLRTLAAQTFVEIGRRRTVSASQTVSPAALAAARAKIDAAFARVMARRRAG
jgi:hypothetical protein